MNVPQITGAVAPSVGIHWGAMSVDVAKDSSGARMGLHVKVRLACMCV